MEEESVQEKDDVPVTYDFMSNSSLEYCNIVESEVHLQDDSAQLNEGGVNEASSSSKKRPREVDEEENWNLVGRNGKRCSQKVDLYINSSEKLPKQFAFAKLLKSNNIERICRVKYINPYKIFIQFENADEAEKLIKCKPLQDLGWRCQKPLEVVVSYGVIKDVELELTEKNILEIISTDRELIAAKRLKRRNKEGNSWDDSETVRLAFKGASLPAFVFIYGLKINVEPYVFPVTQCSRCWRFGHSLRVCPSKKIVCPKCGKGHANCESSIFKCVNCTGNHLSLDRSCPAFKKEKQLRDIMAEFNCSYRKALQMHVPPVPPPPPVARNEVSVIPESPQNFNETQKSSNKLSYANVLKRMPARNNENETREPSVSRTLPIGVSQQNDKSPEKSKKKKNKKKTQSAQEVFDWDMSSATDASRHSDSEGDIVLENEEHGKRDRFDREKENRKRFKSSSSFKQLLVRLYAVFSNSHVDMQSKIFQTVSLVIEWIIPFLGQFIWDLPFKTFFDM